MKNRNLFVPTAVAAALMAMLGVAQAGALNSVPRYVAKEALVPAAGRTAATTAIDLSATGISYAFTTPQGIVINANGSVMLTLTPVPSVVSPLNNPMLGQTGTLGLHVPTTLGAGTDLSTSTAVIGPNGEVIVTLRNTGTANAVLGLGSTVNIGSSGAALLGYAAANGGALSAGTLTVTNATDLFSGAVNAISVSGKVEYDTGVSIQSLDSLSNPTPILQSATAVVATATSSDQFVLPGEAVFSIPPFFAVETVKIDLSASTGPATGLVRSGVFGNPDVKTQTEVVGKVVFGNTPLPLNVTGFYELLRAGGLVDAPVNAVNVISATAFTGNATYVLSPNVLTANATAGAFTPGTAFTLNSASTCAVASLLPSGQLPAAGAITAATPSVTLTGTQRPAAFAPVYICAQYGIVNPISVNQIHVVGTLDATQYHINVPIADTPLYNLRKNGKTVDVRNVVEWSPITDGIYTSYVKIINSGTLAAPVTAQWLNVDGSVGASGVLPFLVGSNNFPAGAVRTFTAKQIQGYIGAPANANAVVNDDRPRLRLTAPTDGLQAQSFLLTVANGNFSDTTGAQ